MRHFILVCDKVTILHSLKEGKWGVKKNNESRLENIELGDILFIYVKGTSALGKGCICGPFVTSKISTEPSEGFYFERGYSKVIEFNQSIETSFISLKQIRHEIEFIKNKSRWGMTFMGRAIIEIKQDDSSRITSEIEINGFPIRM